MTASVTRLYPRWVTPQLRRELDQIARDLAREHSLTMAEAEKKVHAMFVAETKRGTLRPGPKPVDS